MFEVSVDRPILKSVLTEPMLAVLVVLLLSTFFHSPSPLLRVWWTYRHIRLCVHVVARGQSVGCGSLLSPYGSSGFNSVLGLASSKKL